jgi:outer membrane protein OmpA-like peptidoglycan-associated protein
MAKAFEKLQIRRVCIAFRRGLPMLVFLLFFTACADFNLLRKRDKDKDGIVDKIDKCPDTPAGVAVDETGCPLDGDKDGVPDYQDQCPTEAGTAAMQGCADADNDGVADKDDQCPDQAGTAALRGCPDADKDGVTDKDDKCPDTPAGTQVDATGCPLVADADGDGIPDNVDKCPGSSASVAVDRNGCPQDGDKDSVPDSQDRCPNTPGTAANRGCPEMKLEERKHLQEATKYIHFEPDKKVPLSGSLPILQNITARMTEYPDYILSIAAHTDNLESNGDGGLRLAEDRAAFARTFLLSQGVPAKRIVSRSYGSMKPIGDNTSAAGRSLNRRVDFDLFLAGEPNAAEVKYGAGLTNSPADADADKSTSGNNTSTVTSEQSKKCYEEGSAVYNTPRKMVKGRMYNVVLSLVAGVVDSLRPRQQSNSPRRQLPSTKITSQHLIVDSYLGVPVVPNERNISLERIKITPFISIDLSLDTSYFHVTPEEPQVFVNVKNDTIQQRVWRVRPKKAGERLPLNFIIRGSCDDISLKNSKPFYKTIEVTVTEPPKPMPDRITEFMDWAKKNLISLIAILTSLSAIYAWFKRGRTGEIQPEGKPN